MCACVYRAGTSEPMLELISLSIVSRSIRVFDALMYLEKSEGGSEGTGIWCRCLGSTGEAKEGPTMGGPTSLHEF